MWTRLQTGKGFRVAGKDRHGSLPNPKDGKQTVRFRAEGNRMYPNQSIRSLQKAWAKSKGLSFDSRATCRMLRPISEGPLSDQARQAFERGAGSELARHMKALHSSSALVANFFDYWTNRDSTGLLAAMEIDAGKGESLDFEARFPTGLGGTCQ